MTEKIGFIGLGVMGRPMALHLIRAGYPLSVYARRAQSLAPLTVAGATACASPQELATHSDIIITMVTNTADVEQVVLGDDDHSGIIHGAKPGSVVIDMSTIAPAATRRMAQRLAERGVDMLDAPVSGGETGAVNATLSIMVGGEAEVFERVKPLFACLGKSIVHIGGHGAGHATKACNQLALAIAIEAAAEALLLAKSYGIDPAKARAAMMGGLAASRALETFGLRMVEQDFNPGVEARWYDKDMQIVMELARELGLALPAGAAAAKNFNALIGAGGGKRDAAALITLLEGMRRNA